MNTYDGGTGYFNINSADIDETGLDALKGSTIGSGDSVYCSEGYTAALDLARNTNLKNFFLGDNPTGTATVKRGYGNISAAKSGYTVSFYSTSVHDGLSGTGSLSKYTIGGASAASRVVIKSNTGGKCSDYNVRACANEYQHVEFLQFVGIYEANTATIMNDVLIDGNNATSTSGLTLYAAPATFNSVEIKRQAVTVFAEAAQLSDADFNRIMDNLIVTYSATGGRAFYFYQSGTSKKYRIRRGPAQITDRNRHFRRPA